MVRRVKGKGGAEGEGTPSGMAPPPAPPPPPRAALPAPAALRRALPLAPLRCRAAGAGAAGARALPAAVLPPWGCRCHPHPLRATARSHPSDRLGLCKPSGWGFKRSNAARSWSPSFQGASFALHAVCFLANAGRALNFFFPARVYSVGRVVYLRFLYAVDVYSTLHLWPCPASLPCTPNHSKRSKPTTTTAARAPLGARRAARALAQFVTLHSAATPAVGRRVG